jgi:phage repressor protein C with HTH and peptisase S24 domain
MSTVVNIWFSASQLATLGSAKVIPGMPRTEKAARAFAKKSEWPHRIVEGSGGKGGMRTEYQPPANVLGLIHDFLKLNPNIFNKTLLLLERSMEAGLSDVQKNAIQQHTKNAIHENTINMQELHVSTAPYPTGIGSDQLVTGDGKQRAVKAQEERVNSALESPEHATMEIDYYPLVKGSAGSGQFVDHEDERVVFKVNMDARLVRERVGSNLRSIKLANVSGDSMHPTLSHGDQVVIDTSVKIFIDDGIYAFIQDGFMRFKRINKRLDGRIIVKSDNPSVGGEPEIYTSAEAETFHIVGIVVPFKFGRFKV